jgi:hypothetical protein
MTMTDYVRNVCRNKLIRGERLTCSDFWACAVNGVDTDALEDEVNNLMKEEQAND